MPIEIPYLSQKVKALIISARRPEIETQQALAKELGITNSYLDKILNNRLSEYESNAKNSMSQNVIERILKTYYLSEEVFLISDLNIFKNHINDPDKVFEDILDEAIIEPQKLSIESRTHRGASLVIEETEGCVYELGEIFKVQLQVKADWSVLLFCKDPQEWCQLDIKQWVQPQGEMTEGIFSSDLYRFNTPLGQHFLLAILTELPLSINQLKFDNAYQMERIVNQLGAELTNYPKNKKQLYKLPFAVNTS